MNKARAIFSSSFLFRYFLQLPAVFGCLFVFILGNVNAAEGLNSSLIIEDKNVRYSAITNTRYYEDKSALLTYEDILKNNTDDFQHFEERHKATSFGSSDSAFWLVFTVKNTNDESTILHIEVDNPIIDEITFYIPDSNVKGNVAGEPGEKEARGFTTIVTGNKYPYDTRSIRSNLFAVKTELAAFDTQTIYIRTVSDRKAYFPITVYSGTAYDLGIFSRQLSAGTFLGIIIGLIGFNIFIFLHIRSHLHLYYLLFALFTAGTILVRQNYLYVYWPDSPEWNMRAYAVVPMTWGLLLMVFFRSYFDTHKYFPRIDKACLFVMLYVFIFMFIPIGENYELFVMVFQIPVSLFGIAIFYVIWKRMRAGFAPAKWFFAGMLLPMFTISIVTLMALGALPNSGAVDVFVGNMEVLELLLFSLGMAEIIKVMSDEQMESERRAMLEISSNRSMTRFMEQMSYQIRTPMNAVIGGVELLKRERLKTDEKRYVDMIESSGFSLLTIIDDIIDYNESETNSLKLEPTRFDLNELIEESINTFRLSAKDRGIELVSNLTEEGNVQVYTDPIRLRQIFVNLLGNAMKFTERGSITLGWERLAVVEQEDCELYKFTITDTGVGMSEEQQANLFQSYSQGDKSISRTYGGTGLGLSISRQLVELMHGQIGVESEQGVGSTFWFTTRFERIRKEKSATPHFKKKRSWRSIRKVLVVDDDASSRMVFSALLRQMGLVVVTAKDGDDAVDMYRSGPSEINMIFMDCKMPNMDGFDAAEEIRRYESAVSIPPKPIFGVSAHVVSDIEKSVVDAGMDGFLSKPILLAKVMEALEQAHNIHRKNGLEFISDRK